jgi:hypothetical protein
MELHDAIAASSLELAGWRQNGCSKGFAVRIFSPVRFHVLKMRTRRMMSPPRAKELTVVRGKAPLNGVFSGLLNRALAPWNSRALLRLLDPVCANAENDMKCLENKFDLRDQAWDQRVRRDFRGDARRRGT